MQTRLNKTITVEPFDFRKIHKEMSTALKNQTIDKIQKNVPVERTAIYLLALVLASMVYDVRKSAIDYGIATVVSGMNEILQDLPESGFAHAVGPFLFVLHSLEDPFFTLCNLTPSKENTTLHKQITQLTDLGDFKKSESFSTGKIINEILDDLSKKKNKYLLKLFDYAFGEVINIDKVKRMLLRLIGVHYLTHELRKKGSLGPSEILADMKVKFGKWTANICENDDSWGKFFGRPSHLTKIINSVHFADIEDIKDKEIVDVKPTLLSSNKNTKISYVVAPTLSYFSKKTPFVEQKPPSDNDTQPLLSSQFPLSSSY